MPIPGEEVPKQSGTPLNKAGARRMALQAESEDELEVVPAYPWKGRVKPLETPFPAATAGDPFTIHGTPVRPKVSSSSQAASSSQPPPPVVEESDDESWGNWKPQSQAPVAAQSSHQDVMQQRMTDLRSFQTAATTRRHYDMCASLV